MPPSIWPVSPSGFRTRPASIAAATCRTRTKPSSSSTSTTARSAAKAKQTWMSPWPFSSNPSVRPVVVDGFAGDRLVEQVRELDERRSACGDPAVGERELGVGWHASPARSRARSKRVLTDRRAGHLHRAARHHRLARRGGGSGAADQGVDRVHDDTVDLELSPDDLAEEGVEALAHLDRGGVDLRHRPVGRAGERDPCGGGVVESLAERHVLVADGEADASLDPLAVGDVARAARIAQAVSAPEGLGRGEGDGRRSARSAPAPGRCP